MNLCETCRYWNRELEDLRHIYEPTPEYREAVAKRRGIEPAEVRLGICTSSSLPNGANRRRFGAIRFIGERAILPLDTGIVAQWWLSTMHDFGCVCWEAKCSEP